MIAPSESHEQISECFIFEGLNNMFDIIKAPFNNSRHRTFDLHIISSLSTYFCINFLNRVHVRFRSRSLAPD